MGASLDASETMFNSKDPPLTAVSSQSIPELGASVNPCFELLPMAILLLGGMLIDGDQALVEGLSVSVVFTVSVSKR